ncbi:MAG: hypothetical protein CSA66_02675 [Proteobacteria bacterium]|nr:MAG: hypothetical protein CSA66_02675 [Pseudomonadota bacterium]
MKRLKAYLASLALLAGAAAVTGCDSDSGGGDGTTTVTEYRAALAETLLAGASDNAEVIKVIGDSDAAILVSSKARKVTRVSVTSDGRLSQTRDRVLFEEDTTESELTHIDVSSDGTWAALTRTIIETDGAGAQTACGGEVVFIDATDSDSFGDVLAQLPVGPMPDSVDISDDDTLVAVANERDGPDAWGKCEVDGATPSISVVDVSAGASSPTELHRVEMIDGDTGPREPESVVFGADNDLVVATLQDSHEVAIFKVSDLAGNAAPTSDDIMIVSLPTNALGAGAWPDGVTRFVDGQGHERFAIAGEWNDTLTTIAGDGRVLASVELDEGDFPPTLPRVVAEGYPLFSPDSLSAFVFKGNSYLAVTLRHSGAVLIYDVTDAAAPTFGQVVAVGQDEQGGLDEDGSTIRPEGVAAAPDGRFIVVANEGESSVSLLLPEE